MERAAPLFLTLIFHCCSLTSPSKNIEIITSLPYNLGIAPDIRITGAAYELAAENVMRSYCDASMTVSPVNVRLRYLFNATNSNDIRTCDDIANRSAQMLSEYYYKLTVPDTCYAVVSSRKEEIGKFVVELCTCTDNSP